MMSNLEIAAEIYARKIEAAYIAKRGGRALQAAAFNVYVWAFNRYMQNPEIDA